MSQPAFRAPRDCPVCSQELHVSRVSCPGCGAELAGQFTPCEFCNLDDAELDLVRLFLGARGNLREVAKHLEVSYPTARARLTDVLSRLGLGTLPRPDARSRDAVLADVASGRLTPEEASALLA